jgi:hypothetical protein
MVEIRFVWSDEAAFIVTVAPVAVVTTVGELRITPLLAAKSIVAPATEAFPEVSAYTESVTVEVPSAFKTVALELTLIVATVEFAAAGALAPETGGTAPA